MKLRESLQRHEIKLIAQESPATPVLHPSIMVWTLHWVSTLLVLFLLATSLASGLGFTKRPFPSEWMDWHLSAGVALLVITTVRIKTSRPWSGLTRAFAFGRPDAQAIRSILLLAVLVVVLSGLAIFQKPPFGRAGTLFGLVPMPTLIRLDHSIHNVIIDLHIALACVIAGLIVAHAFKGLRCVPAGG